MKKIILVMMLLISYTTFEVNIIAEENDLSDEVKEVIEDLVKVKMIEWEIVFGYPIEDVKLIDNLSRGRNIDYILEHFDKYYEDKVLEEYLYYLKRSTTQTFYYEIGVFWGANQRTVGNIYKREATALTYDIDYLFTQQKGDTLIVGTRVYPTYHGEYSVRGVTSTEYESDSKDITFHLRKDAEGNYKLTQLNEEIKDEMEKEIGEGIVLNRNIKREVNYPQLAHLNYKTNSQEVGFNLAFDIMSLLDEGGLDALYDNYDKVWLDLEFINRTNLDVFNSKINEGNITLDCLREDYAGWDYGYTLSTWGCNWEERKGAVLVYDVDENNEVTRLSIMHNIEVMDDWYLENYEGDIKKLEPYLNQEMDLALGFNGNKNLKLQSIENYFEKAYSTEWLIYPKGVPLKNDYEGTWAGTWTFYGELNKMTTDSSRRVESGNIPYWYFEPDTQEYALMLPPSDYVAEPYTDTELIYAYNCIGGDCSEDSFETGYILIGIEPKYFYPEINLYIYWPDRQIELQRESVNQDWKITEYWNLDGVHWVERIRYYNKGE